jgi:hypothetical protein
MVASVSAAVDLDNNSTLEAREIENVTFPRNLPTKVITP